jgi:glycosyltransferase involved in cell wall biosynthesis
MGTFVVTVHDLTMIRQGIAATKLPLPIYYAKRIPFLLIAKNAVKSAMKIITPSKSALNDVVKYYSIDQNKVKSIYEGISDLKLKSVPTISINKPYFFYVGNSYPHKNLKRLIEAAKHLNEQENEKALLVIAGSRDFFKNKLTTQVKDLKAQKYVKIIGYVHDNDLASVYGKSVGFVYPSTAEGFGLQGLEAMAAGTLVLASDIPVFKEIYADHALYFNPHDFTSIAKSMKSALTMNKAVRRENIAKSQSFIKRYSWSVMAKQTYDVYQEILN